MIRRITKQAVIHAKKVLKLAEEQKEAERIERINREHHDDYDLIIGLGRADYGRSSHDDNETSPHKY